MGTGGTESEDLRVGCKVLGYAFGDDGECGEGFECEEGFPW